MRNLIVNEYTVGGSLLLVGFGFFSTRFADILSYQVTTIPSAIPVVGGASVTVGPHSWCSSCHSWTCCSYGQVPPNTSSR